MLVTVLLGELLGFYPKPFLYGARIAQIVPECQKETVSYRIVGEVSTKLYSNGATEI